MRSMVEGHVQVIPTLKQNATAFRCEVGITRACPSTTFGGPPPRFGED